LRIGGPESCIFRKDPFCQLYNVYLVPHFYSDLSSRQKAGKDALFAPQAFYRIGKRGLNCRDNTDCPVFSLWR
jgi:hypothetical protein